MESEQVAITAKLEREIAQVKQLKEKLADAEVRFHKFASMCT